MHHVDVEDGDRNAWDVRVVHLRLHVAINASEEIAVTRKALAGCL